jgi:hypothetical protein
VQGVQQPYVTCVTTFSGKESQAVVATRHDSSLVCTLLPPESNASYTTATVHIQTRPPQPGKHPGVDLQHKVRFIQPPIVHNVLFKYAADVGEHIEVVLNKAAPLQKVRVPKETAFFLCRLRNPSASRLMCSICCFRKQGSLFVGGQGHGAICR